MKNPKKSSKTLCASFPRKNGFSSRTNSSGMAVACALPASRDAPIATWNPSVIRKIRPFKWTDFSIAQSLDKKQPTTMNFDFSEKTKDLQRRLQAFMDEHIHPNEQRLEAEIERNHWKPSQIIETLKAKARAAGLWNLFLPDDEHGAGLSNLDYAPLCEIMGRASWAAEAFNCSAPDTGNMEVLARYGTAAQKRAWLEPLLAGKIRSCFAMTEPAVASSDATNIASTVRRDGDHYVINGRKWWATGSPDRRCQLIIFMGQTDPTNPDKHRRQSMILVPMETP